MKPEKRTEITIQGHVFRLRCEKGEERRLHDAAEMVNGRLKEITESGGVVDSLRAALMAAFHFAYELQGQQNAAFQQSPDYQKFQKRLKMLAKEIDTNLSE